MTTTTKRNWLPLFTPYVVEDYPYGFNKRTTMRYEIEYKPKKWFRLWQTTVNPTTWRVNKTKYSTYTSFMRLYIDEATSHVKASSFSSNWATMESYERALGSGIFDDVPVEFYDHKKDIAKTLYVSIRWMVSFEWWIVNWREDAASKRVAPTLTNEEKLEMQKLDLDTIIPIHDRIEAEYNKEDERLKSNNIT